MTRSTRWLRERRGDDADDRRAPPDRHRQLPGELVRRDVRRRSLRRPRRTGRGVRHVERRRVPRSCGRPMQLGCPVAPVRWFEPTRRRRSASRSSSWTSSTAQPPGATIARCRRQLADDFVAPPRRAASHRLGNTPRRPTSMRPTPPTSRSTVGTRCTAPRPTSRSHCSKRARPGCTITPRRSTGSASSTATPDRATSSTTERGSIAFTDWEFTHLGDPMEDWAYLVTMRGSRTMSEADWLALFGRSRRCDRHQTRPAVLERVQLLQGGMRQPDLPAGVRDDQSGAEHGH